MSRRVVTVIGTLAGAALFAYAVRSVGVAEILEGVRRVGWGLVAILALEMSQELFMDMVKRQSMLHFQHAN